MQLGQEGILLSGSLYSATGRWLKGIGKSRYGIDLVYRFPVPGIDRVVRNYETVVRNDLRFSRLPDPGTPIFVIFLDKNNYQLL